MTDEQRDTASIFAIGLGACSMLVNLILFSEICEMKLHNGRIDKIREADQRLDDRDYQRLRIRVKELEGVK